MSNPLVSVIVPTKNSSEFLDACLESIKDQTYKNIELIVVDNNSTDNTKEIARKYTDKVFNHGPERSVQRNFGAKESTGVYVLFIDSDMELAKEVVEECVKKEQATGTMGVVIPEESFGIGFWAQCKKLERSFYVGVEWMEAARFFSRKSFEQVSGYNEQMISGEDWDLSQRVEEIGKIDRIGAFIYHNEGQLRLSELLKKKYYYAQKFATYTIQNKSNSKLKKQVGGVRRFGLFFSKPFRLFKNPFVGIGMLFMKTCEFAAGVVGYVKLR